jgi:hypothetical protein
MVNLGGLAKAMVRDGSIQNAQDLKDFALGFTQAKASFDFIDVGHGKERADSKIKGEHGPAVYQTLLSRDTQKSAKHAMLFIICIRNYEMEPA